jgi:hypothetical protein
MLVLFFHIFSYPQPEVAYKNTLDVAYMHKNICIDYKYELVRQCFTVFQRYHLSSNASLSEPIKRVTIAQ